MRRFKDGDIVVVKYFRQHADFGKTKEPEDDIDRSFLNRVGKVSSVSWMGSSWDYEVSNGIGSMPVKDDQLAFPEFIKTELYKALQGEFDEI